MPISSSSNKGSMISNNPSGTTYIKGDANTDGSIRIIEENGIPVIEKRENGVWNDSDLRISGDSLYIGRDLRISAAGHILMVRSVSDDSKTLVIHSHFNDSGSIEPEVPLLATKEIRTITQSDNIDIFTGTSFGYTVTPTENQLISKVYYQTGSIPATDNIIIRFYVGVDNTGVLYFQKTIPSTEWIADSEIQIDVPGLLGYVPSKTVYGELTSSSSFSIKTNESGTQPWRAVDRWAFTRERIAYSSPWSEKTWNKDDWCIDDGKIYVCNTDGSQSGSFEANILKWDLLSDLVAKVIDYKGGITVADFNALTSGNKGEQYKFTDAGTLIGTEVVNANDIIIIRNTFTGRLIAGTDYDFFAEPSDTVLQSGRSGGQSVSGGTNASENLTLKSTENATKGKIIIDDNIEPSNTNSKSLGSLLKVFLNLFTRKVESDDTLDLSAGGTDKNITLTATGIGTIIPASDIVPSTNNTRSIGSITKVFKEVFARKVTSDDALMIMGAANKTVDLMSSGAGAVNVSSEGSGAVNIGADARSKIVTVGNLTGTTTVNIKSGTGGINLNTTTTGAVIIDSGTTGAVNIGNNTNEKTVTIGNTTGATTVNINAGTGNVNIEGNVDLNNKTLRLKTPNLTDIGEDNGISFYEGNDNYKIGYDSVGGTKGYLRHNVDLVDVGHGHVFSAGDLESGETDLMLIRADGNVSIGGEPNTSAILDLVSTSKGFRVPRMSQAQRLAIVSPPEGLEVYQTDESKGKYIYNGTRWDKMSNFAYLKASNTVAVNPSANTLLNFSSGVVLNGVKTNMGGGRYELYPGVYELMGVQLLNENDAGISYQFYNYTTSSYIGEKGNAADVVGSAGTGSPAFAILECTVDTQIGLRCSNDSATVTATEGNWIKIKQIS